MEILMFAFLVALIIWLFPLVLALIGIVFCLFMAALFWIYEILRSPFKKKTGKKL